MDWTENALELVATGGTCSPVLVGNGTAFEPYRAMILPSPMEVTYIRPCHYCRHKIHLDSRGRCQNCGAPEHLAIEPFVPFLTLPDDHTQNPGPK